MELGKFTLADVKEKSYKKRDAWWTVFLVDPLAARLVLPVANYTRITPNQLSLFAFIIGLFSAYYFYLGHYSALVAGAVLFHFSFVLDCMDGKVARLKGTGTLFGMWLDYTLDRVRVIICATALGVGQFHMTGDFSYVYYAIVIIALDAIRYIDALNMYKIRREMRKRINQKRKVVLKRLKRTHHEPIAQEQKKELERYFGPLKPPLVDVANQEYRNEPVQSVPLYRHSEDTDQDHPLQPNAAPQDNTQAGVRQTKDEASHEKVATAEAVTANASAHATEDTSTQPQPERKRKKGTVDLQQTFKSRFGWYMKVRHALEKVRVRPHLFSGVEFQMFIFIIAPICGIIKETVIASAILLLAFELSIIYKMFLSTRDLNRTLQKIDKIVPERVEEPVAQELTPLTSEKA